MQLVLSNHSNHTFWNWTLAMIAITFLSVWSVGLNSYHRNSPRDHQSWWHIAKIDAIGSVFSTITIPLSSCIPKEFSLDFGGRTVYVFGQGAMPSTSRQGVDSYHVTSSIWEAGHLLCTLAVAVSSLFIAWLAGAIAAQQRPRFIHFKTAIRSRMTRIQKMAFAGMTVTMVIGSSCASGYWWNTGCNRATCCLNLRNYNLAIAGCGIDPNALFLWKDIEATKGMVLRHSQLRLPKCPSGGRISLEFGRGFEGRLQPRAVCSKEEELGHICPGINSDESVRDKSGRFNQR
jgi:hypothetical protein